MLEIVSKETSFSSTAKILAETKFKKINVHHMVKLCRKTNPAKEINIKVGTRKSGKTLKK